MLRSTGRLPAQWREPPDLSKKRNAYVLRMDVIFGRVRQLHASLLLHTAAALL